MFGFQPRASRRYLRSAAIALAAAISLTCADSLFEPGMEVSASFDVQQLLASAQSASIPVDSLVIELRRVSDESLAHSLTIHADSITVSDDGSTVSVEIRIPMESSTEQFYLSLVVVGDGIVWFQMADIITVNAGSDPTVVSELIPEFVGPGANATEVLISLPDTAIWGGERVLVSSTVYEGDTVVENAVVSFSSSDLTMVPEPEAEGYGSAWVQPLAALTDEVVITVEVLTADGSLSDAGTLQFYARPDTLQLMSGNDQQMYVGAVAAEPLVVQVVDAAGDPYTRGIAATFSVTSGPANTSVSPTSVVTDGSGYANTELTAGDAVGAIQVTATADGLSTPTVTFNATVIPTVGAANIAIVDGNNQTATVGATLPVSPSVYVSDGAGNPTADEEVTFAVASGGGSVTGGVVMTDAEGMAMVGGWTLGQALGTNTLTATVGVLTPVTFTATGTVDVPESVVTISGNAQTADGGTDLPAPLVVEVQDQYGNAVPGETVSWVALNGSVTPETGTTDGSGRAQTTWTLGTNATSQTASAIVGSLTPAVFSATATFSTPTILMALVGADRISVGSTADLEIMLTSPAGVGGVSVTVTSDNSSVVAVQAPETITIAEGNTTGQVTLDGVAGGSTTVRANATGYAEGTLVVESSVQVLSLPATLNVPFGGTASLPLTISTPAPAGGEAVTLISSNPGSVALQTSTITIPEGSYTANATVSGVLPGTSTVTATSATHGSAQSIVSTTANLNIVEGSLTINESFGSSITVRLESGGLQIAAPAGGIAVTLTAADPGCVSAPPSVTIPAGLVDITALLTYGGSTTTQCNTTVTATATDIISDNLTVYVNPAPGITVNGYSVGSGLQRSTSSYLGAANHGGVDVVVTSSDPAVLLVSPNSSTGGTASITIPVVDGSTSISYYVQGLEGQTGTPDVTISAPGFADGTGSMPVMQPALSISSLSPTTTTLTTDDPFSVRVGIPDAGQTYMAEYQSVRAGAPSPLTATAANSDGAVGQLVTTALTGNNVTVEIAQRSNSSPISVATGGVAFDPLTAGITTVSASIPGFVTLPLGYGSHEVTVTAPAITVNAYSVGSGLQRSGSTYLGGSNHGGVDVVITSSDPAVLLVSPDATTPGTSSITVPVTDGYTTANYYVQGVEGQTGTPDVTVSAPGFTNGTATVTVLQPALTLSSLSNTTTTLTADDPFTVHVGIPNATQTYMSSVQVVRAGAPGPLTASLTSSAPTVGQLVTTGLSGAAVTVEIAEGEYRAPTTVAAGGVAFDPLTAGVTTVSATIPGFITLPLGYGSQEVTVSGPGITASVYSVGGGLQRAANASLGATGHGGVDVVITSSDPAVLLVSPDATTPGTTSITVPVADGSTSISYYIQGVEAQTGTPEVTFSATGFTNGAATMTVMQPALTISSLSSPTTTLTADDPFSVQVGIPNATQTYMAASQVVRAGAPSPLTATITSTASTVGQLVTTALSGATVTVEISEGQYYSPSTVVAGGVAFDPLTAGLTTVSASIPGYVTLPLGYGSQEVTVTAPAVNLSATTTASGLQRARSATLGAGDHGGVDVVITSSNPSVLLLSPDATTAGTASITVPVADGYTGFSYYAQGVEGATGTVTITATADGFTDGTTPTEVVQPAVDIYNLGATTTTQTPDDPFQVRVGIPYPGNTYVQTTLPVRAGAPSPLTVTVSSSVTTVGQLVTTPLTGGTITVEIAEGSAYTPNTVAIGGVAFEPLEAGTTTVSASIPGFISTTNAAEDVVVTASAITMYASTVGSGLQYGNTAYLGGTDHGGVDVVITSSNPALLLVSPDPATPGTTSITVPVADGYNSITYYIQGVEGQTGSAEVTTTAPGFTGGSATKDVVQPAITLYSIYTTMTTDYSDDPFRVQVGIPNTEQTVMQTYQEVRAGAPSAFTATVTSTNASVGQLVTTAVSGGSVTVQIVEGEYYSPNTVALGGVAISPLSVGTTTVAASIPGFLTLPLGYGSVEVSVITP